MHKPEKDTRDPSDGGTVRAMGHRTVDDRVGRLAGVHDRPVWQPVPEEMRRRFALRCAITHHRSRREDFDLLGHEVVRIGDELMKEA